MNAPILRLSVYPSNVKPNQTFLVFLNQSSLKLSLLLVLSRLSIKLLAFFYIIWIYFVNTRQSLGNTCKLTYDD